MPNNEPTEAMEACPFCGAAGHISHNPRAGKPYWRPSCSECSIMMAGFNSEAEAIAAWNHRTDSIIMRAPKALKPFAPDADDPTPASVPADGLFKEVRRLVECATLGDNPNTVTKMILAALSTNTPAISGLAERLTSFANGLRGSMWANRNETIELLDEAAAALRSTPPSDGLREAISDGIATLSAVRATAEAGEEWEQSGPHFSRVCLDTIKRMNAALLNEGSRADGR